MTGRLLAPLARLDPRALRLLLPALLLFLALESWLLVLRAPVSQWQALRSTRAALSTIAQPPLAGEIARLKAELTSLQAAEHEGEAAASVPEEAVMGLMNTLSQVSARHGVSLGGVRPGGQRLQYTVLRSDFEVEVQGSYAALVAWLLDARQAVAPLALDAVQIQAGSDGSRLALSLHLAAYRMPPPPTAEAKP